MKNWQRILSVVLCLSLLIFFSITPVQASASAAAAATCIVGGAGAILEVIVPIAAVVLLVIGVLGFSGSISDVVATAREWYNYSAVKAWADSISSYDLFSSASISIPNKLQSFLFSQAEAHKVSIPSSIPFLYIPSDIGSLDEVDPGFIFPSVPVGDAGTIRIGYGDDASDVPAVLVPFVLILIGAGYTFPSLSALVNTAESLYTSTAGELSEWADSIALSIIDGTSAFKLNSTVRTEVNKKLDDDKQIPPELPLVIVPGSLLSLDTLSQEEVFTTSPSVENQLDSTMSFLSLQFYQLKYWLYHLNYNIKAELHQTKGWLKDINENVKLEFGQVKTWLQSINENVLEQFRQVRGSLVSIQENLLEQFSQIKGFLSSINTNVQERLTQVVGWLSDLNTNIVSEFKQVKTWLSNINTNMKNEIFGLKTILLQIKDTALSGVTQAIANIELKLDAALGSITAALQPSPVPDPDEGTKDFITNGVNRVPVIFGESNGILAQHATGFLVATMIFNEFANISLINQILVVSISIGIVGVFLGIALNATASSKAEMRRSQKAKEGSA